MKTLYISIVLLLVACLINFWALGNAYERIYYLEATVDEQTDVINQHADAITHNAGIMDENTRLVDEVIDYLNAIEE